MDNEYYMVNPLYMQYITDDKNEVCHKSLSDMRHSHGGSLSRRRAEICAE